MTKELCNLEQLEERDAVVCGRLRRAKTIQNTMSTTPTAFHMTAIPRISHWDDLTARLGWHLYRTITLVRDELMADKGQVTSGIMSISFSLYLFVLCHRARSSRLLSSASTRSITARQVPSRLRHFIRPTKAR